MSIPILLGLSNSVNGFTSVRCHSRKSLSDLLDPKFALSKMEK